MKAREMKMDVRELLPERPRAPGLHFSDVVKPLLRNWDPERFGGKKPETGLDDRKRSLFLVGFIFEEAMNAAFAKIMREARGLTQLEIEAEMAGRKITLTIDLFDPRSWLVCEGKTTFMSSRRPITDRKLWHYLVQVKAYCWATETTEAELWVLFLRGDYGENWTPEVKRWRLEFTRAELAENWKMLENKLRDMIRKGEVEA